MAPGEEAAAGRLVARVAALTRFPVKSMAGERLEAVRAGGRGLEGDRRYAFVRADAPASFPWLTIRQVPDLLRHVPAFAAPEHPERSPVVVATPDGRRLDLRDGALAEELAAAYGRPVSLVHAPEGSFDAFPVSLISRQTVDALGTLAERPLDPARFRANVVLDLLGGDAFAEDDWPGRVLAFGPEGDGAHVRVDERDHRCAVINFEPGSASRHPEVLRTVARHRDACAGVYGAVTRPGRIRVGDPVRLLGRAP